MHPSVPLLWQRFRVFNPSAPADLPDAFHFCDNQEDANTCANLVVAGRKRATASSLAELEITGVALPKVDDYAIVTDWEGQAKAVIQTKSIDVKTFIEVTEDFAREEGEGDLTLGWWRTAHRAYYERVLAGSQYQVNDELQIACERFEVVMTA